MNVSMVPLFMIWTFIMHRRQSWGGWASRDPQIFGWGCLGSRGVFTK